MPRLLEVKGRQYISAIWPSRIFHEIDTSWRKELNNAQRPNTMVERPRNKKHGPRVSGTRLGPRGSTTSSSWTSTWTTRASMAARSPSGSARWKHAPRAWMTSRCGMMRSMGHFQKKTSIIDVIFLYTIYIFSIYISIFLTNETICLQ